MNDPAPTEIDLSYLPRPWHCEQCNWTLGVVLRNKGRVRRLYVFRDACHPETVFVWDGKIGRGVFRVPGMDSGEVECEHCGNVQTWSMSEEALRRLKTAIRTMHRHGEEMG